MYIFEMFSILVSYLCLVVGVLVSVAFMVLFERKILGYIQIRKGPNKVGYLGILQSFGDAIKLFIKEQTFPLNSNMFIYYFSPVFSIFVMLVLWAVIPYNTLLINFSFGGFIFFCCTSFGVYTLMSSGWSSNSNYALIGAVRGVAQTISYEVSMALIFLSLVFLGLSYSLLHIMKVQKYILFIFVMFPIFICWLTSCLAETNRTPFDFAEGESELVSGFNIEYGSGGFALLFLAEYGSIIFMSYFLACLFFGGLCKLFILMNLFGSFFCFWFIWVRGTLPRYRYDKLMYLAWKSFLPVSLWFLCFFLGASIFI
uniref:NADH-ubiquinone oxidoreductase chain 1 n=1 Tax=Dicranocentrus wangi TaxID=1302322 RepID=A0A6H0EXQ1_9HEXA|nr:NADH dehydrogenase subunit 1 [Dicranocentrus wangi]QIT06444.1 NADH dehydrogenase subunit 1 [Dicranocentrus wangi]